MKGRVENEDVYGMGEVLRERVIEELWNRFKEEEGVEMDRREKKKRDRMLKEARKRKYGK